MISVEVATTGVTIGSVLQTTVEEVSWRVRTVSEVMMDVFVFVLVTKEQVSIGFGLG